MLERAAELDLEYLAGARVLYIGDALVEVAAAAADAAPRTIRREEPVPRPGRGENRES